MKITIKEALPKMGPLIVSHKYQYGILKNKIKKSNQKLICKKLFYMLKAI